MAQLIDDRWVVSPQDLVGEYECEHSTALNAAVRTDTLQMTFTEDPALAVLRAQGLQHETSRLLSLEVSQRVKKLGGVAHTRESYRAGWQATQQAMEEEYDAIYQATLFTEDFVGLADFLILARDSDGNIIRDAAGIAIYEPVDTKSARSAKRSAVLQVGAYAEALVRLGRPAPRHVHLWLAGENDWQGPADKFIAVARHYRERVTARLPELGDIPEPAWAPPRPACTQCRFATWCDEGRHSARDVSLIQGIRSVTRQRIVEAGMTTIDDVASATDDQRPPRVSLETFASTRAQADIQVRGDGVTPPLFEITDPGVLASLPPRSDLDLWFDMEGDPYAPGEHGLEYMFGYGFLVAGEFDFDATIGHDWAGERRAFEDFIDEVTRRIKADPGMHVYHYADYERRTLQRLAQQHGTREDEVDQLLQQGRLIDLYSIVRRSLRFSTESLSLKYIEAVYDVTHAGEDVSTAMDSVIQYERYVALMAEGLTDEAAVVLESIRDYNRLDCESTMRLDDWLRSIQPSSTSDEPVPSTDLADADADTGDERAEDPFADLIAALEDGLTGDSATRSDTDRARALLAAALLYHPRERRPAWWQLFELIKADRDDLDRASDVLLIDHAQATPWDKTGRMKSHRRDVTVASHSEDPRLILDGTEGAFLLYDIAPAGMARPSDSTRGYNPGTVTELDDETATLMERAGFEDQQWPDLPIAVLPGPPFNTNPIRAAIAAAAQSIAPADPAAPWVFPDRAWADLLLSRAPRSRTGSHLPRTGDGVDDIVAALKDSDDSYVAVQGPPGTGKTYVGSRAVARLASQGWRIGVVAQSHAVVDNFLEAVHETGPAVAIGKETQGSKPATQPWHLTGKDKVQTWSSAQPSGYVIGGTAWTFSRDAVRDLNLDLLVIDEGGQFALANAIACSLAARTVLVLGDPQQLPQVSQAAHPEAIEASMLEHIIGDHATMPDDRGYFLPDTYRMHPALTSVVSDLQYEGRLHSAPVTSLRHLDGVPPGLTAIAVDHHGNTTSSPEEGQRVIALVADLLERSWTGARNDAPQQPRPLGHSDIIIVAAYNAQVRLLKRMLADAGYGDIPVGTVDKFQGREEVVVIMSMATSSDEDLPRGLDFLLSPNRLNVAISRAQWACLLVHSPELLQARPSSVDGVQRLGGFLGLVTRDQG